MKIKLRETEIADVEPSSPQSPAPAHAASSDLLALIDQALAQYAGRRLVASVEVTDLLLDLR